MRSIKTCDGVFENILTTFKLQNCIHSRFNHTPCCLHFHVHTHSLFMSLSYSMHALIHLHILSYLCQKNRSLAFDTPTSNPRATREFLCNISGNIGGHSNDLRSTHHHRSFFDEVHRYLTQSKLKSDAENFRNLHVFSVLEILVKIPSRKLTCPPKMAFLR